MTSPHRDLKYAKELTDRYCSHHFQNKENELMTQVPQKLKQEVYDFTFRFKT